MSSPSIEGALQALLLAFETDPTAVDYLLKANAAVGPGIKAHPTIPIDENGALTGLGLINGLLRAATGSVLNAHYTECGTLAGFSIRTVPGEPRTLLAIPVLVYVEPGPVSPLTNECFEERVRAALAATPGVYEVFIAEDFETTACVQQSDDELTPRIGVACEPA